MATTSTAFLKKNRQNTQSVASGKSDRVIPQTVASGKTDKGGPIKNRGKAQYLLDNGRGIPPKAAAKPEKPAAAMLKVAAPRNPKPKNPNAGMGSTLRSPANPNRGLASASSTAAPKNPNNGLGGLSKGSTTPAFQPAGSTEQRGAVASTTFKGNWVNAGPTELQKRGGARSTAASRKLAREDFGRNR